MSLTYNIERYDVIDLYQSLIKSYSKNIYFLATPTSETYTVKGYNNNTYTAEYQYKFCYSLDKVDLNGNVYSTKSNFICYYFRNDGKTDVKNVGRVISVMSNQNAYSNAHYKQVQSVPMSIENYGGIFYDSYTMLTFFAVAFVMCFVIVRSVFPRWR